MNQSTIIAIFCYKRAAKLKTCIEALLKNPECKTLDIIFFCDGYKSDSDKEGVLETRAYIDSITGFKEVHKRYREKNYSTGPNFRDGLTFLCNNYEQFIVVEDDLVVSPNYLSYMLEGLDFYKDQKSVFCITGYCFPLDVSNYAYDTVMCKRFCSYGWAAWSHKVKHVTWDLKELDNLIKTSPDFKKRLNSEGFDLFRMLVKQIKGKISTWDIQLQVHVAENKLKVVYPVLSKVRNIGFDTESTNTFGFDYLKTPVDIGEKKVFNFCDANSNEPVIQQQLKKPYALKALVTRKIINTFIKVTSQVKKAH
ncbi:MAG: glycosyltransferase [Chitinophagaceae bacterium]